MMIECHSIKGNKVMIDETRLSWRPSAYGIIMKDDQIVTMKVKTSGKLFLPGGGVETNETLEQALHREIKEETGLEVKIIEMIDFQQSFFYYDPEDSAYNSLCFFYLCEPITTELIGDDEVDDTECETPRWRDLNDLTADDFQPIVSEAFTKIKNTYISQ